MQWQRDGTVDAHESGIYVSGVKTADAKLEAPSSDDVAEPGSAPPG